MYSIHFVKYCVWDTRYLLNLPTTEFIFEIHFLRKLLSFVRGAFSMPLSILKLETST